MAKQDDRAAKMAPYEEAIQITMELNQVYHSPEKRRDLMAQLIGKPVDESFTLFPPFYSDYGKNIRIGKNVFINSSCHFQDQGGHRNWGWLPDWSQCCPGHRQPRPRSKPRP